MASLLRVMVLSLLMFSSSAKSQERVHSDLPLFSGRHGELQPIPFRDADSFGCSSRIAFGDWKYVEPREDARPTIDWLRLRNYGVFHCAVIEEWAPDRERLGLRGYKHSWFVELGVTKRGKSTVELWALQSGARPGSDYLLLARTPAPGLIKAFEVLPVDCPEDYLRKGDGPDIWRADYCAINSADELRSFARKMASRRAIGTLTWVEGVPETPDVKD